MIKWLRRSLRCPLRIWWSALANGCSTSKSSFGGGAIGSAAQVARMPRIFQWARSTAARPLNANAKPAVRSKMTGAVGIFPKHSQVIELSSAEVSPCPE